MSKETKHWLYMALIITGLFLVKDASENRMLTVLADIVMLFSIALLLMRRRFGFALMVMMAIAGFAVNTIHSLLIGTMPVLSVTLALLDAVFVPTVTGYQIQSEWNDLK